MVNPHKKQKVENIIATYKEEVLFNSDTLSKVISYLPSTDLLNLALTCKRFGISSEDGKSSLIEESARIAIRDIATKGELAALPYYNGESSLADYHYLQFMRGPLTFDQLTGDAEFVSIDDKSCVTSSGNGWDTAFSNNIMKTGKHYATFEGRDGNLFVGVLRPGKANQEAYGSPLYPNFYQNFSPNVEYNNNDVQCCLYRSIMGRHSLANDWSVSDTPTIELWDEVESGWQGRERRMSSGIEILGILLDLDEGTLSVFRNGRKLGVMKRRLAGPYCWVVSIWRGNQVTIKRGTIPPS